MQVKDIMSRPVVTVPESSTLDQVARTMLDKRIGCVVVVGLDGEAVGVLTERDFTAREPANPFQKNRAPVLFGRNVRQHGMETLYAEARAIPAWRLMRPIAASLESQDAVEKAVDLMNRHELLHLVVLRDDRPVGVVSRHDLLRLVYPNRPEVRTAAA